VVGKLALLIFKTVNLRVEHFHDRVISRDISLPFEPEGILDSVANHVGIPLKAKSVKERNYRIFYVPSYSMNLWHFVLPSVNHRKGWGTLSACPANSVVQKQSAIGIQGSL